MDTFASSSRCCRCSWAARGAGGGGGYVPPSGGGRRPSMENFHILRSLPNVHVGGFTMGCGTKHKSRRRPTTDENAHVGGRMAAGSSAVLGLFSLYTATSRGSQPEAKTGTRRQQRHRGQNGVGGFSLFFLLRRSSTALDQIKPWKPVTLCLFGAGGDGRR
ncbi:hypothetical protein LY76DRAFT_269095 [Colletotrichum caudatum]|nr:hypothetical protein LY76DRAFT_269095 [Colletotrichum caudatum]